MNSLIEYLTVASGPLLIGATLIFVVGLVAVLAHRTPILRQRIGELTLIAALLWLFIPLAPKFDLWKVASQPLEPVPSLVDSKNKSIGRSKSSILPTELQPSADLLVDDGRGNELPFLSPDPIYWQELEFDNPTPTVVEVSVPVVNHSAAFEDTLNDTAAVKSIPDNVESVPDSPRNELVNEKSPHAALNLRQSDSNSGITDSNHAANVAQPATRELTTETGSTFAASSMQFAEAAAPTAIVIYLSGVLVCITWLFVGHLLLFRMNCSSQLVGTVPNENQPNVARVFLQLIRECHLSKSPRLLVSSKCERVITFGIFRPTIVLPLGLVNENDQSKLRHVLLHELGHIHQRDAYGQVLMNAAFIFFFFHPIYWMIRKRICFERELVVDDWAAHRSIKTKYVADLVAIAKQRSNRHVGPSLVMSAVDLSQSQFYRRIKMLVNRKTSLQLKRPRWLATTQLSMMIALVLGSAISIDVPRVVAQDDKVQELKMQLEIAKQQNNSLEMQSKMQQERMKMLEQELHHMRAEFEQMMAMRDDKLNHSEASRQEIIQQLENSRMEFAELKQMIGAIRHEQFIEDVSRQRKNAIGNFAEADATPRPTPGRKQTQNPFSGSPNQTTSRSSDPFSDDIAEADAPSSAGEKSNRQNSPFDDKPQRSVDRATVQETMPNLPEMHRGDPFLTEETPNRTGGNQARNSRTNREQETSIQRSSNAESDFIELAVRFTDALAERDIAEVQCSHLRSGTSKGQVSKHEYEISSIKLKAAKRKVEMLRQVAVMTIKKLEVDLELTVSRQARNQKLAEKGYLSDSALAADNSEIAKIKMNIDILRQVIQD